MSLYVLQQAMCYPATAGTICSDNSVKGCCNGIRRENRSNSFRLYERGQKKGCLHCDGAMAKGSTGDHLLARHSGGPDGAQNYIPLCGRCNSSKGKTEFFTWWQKKNRSAAELPADLLCAYARLWWQKHEADGTLDMPAPTALVRAVLELRAALPIEQQWAVYHAREASLALALETTNGE